MLTGSFASAWHGLPRATQDIDFVIAPTLNALRAFVRALPRDAWYADEQTALEALGAEGQFNLIDLASGWKVDLICRRSRPFSRTEFERRLHVDLDGLPLCVASAEDLIVAKLEWAQRGGSARQLEDTAGILRMRAGLLDVPYLERWVVSLGLGSEWAAAQRLAAAAGPGA
jgi:hypothetical protein